MLITRVICLFHDARVMSLLRDNKQPNETFIALSERRTLKCAYQGKNNYIYLYIS